MNEFLGKHLIIEFFECSNEILDNLKFLEEKIPIAAEKAGATVIKSLFHKFSPYGVTGVVVLAESHLSIHTWPEYGYAAVDVFTCGDLIDNNKALIFIKDLIKSKRFTEIELERGKLEVPGKLKHKPGA